MSLRGHERLHVLAKRLLTILPRSYNFEKGPELVHRGKRRPIARVERRRTQLDRLTINRDACERRLVQKEGVHDCERRKGEKRTVVLGRVGRHDVVLTQFRECDAVCRENRRFHVRESEVKERGSN